MPADRFTQVLVSPDAPVAVRFAAAEIRRCLLVMTGRNVGLRHVMEFSLDEPGTIMVGEREQFAHVLDPGRCPPHDLDDEILVTQAGGNCIVTGSNPRSVLYAGYDLLEGLGARWVAPGHLGEILPSSDCSQLFSREISESASYRHRGVCIEGAPSVEHALDMVDWMAKRKMNTFYLQFKTSVYFWRNYYSREYNADYGTPEKIDLDRSRELDQEVIDAVKRRGMVLHRVGHGWTAESLGYEGLGWWKSEREPDEETRGLLAQVNGKRDFFGNVPINTELCYSNPKAFRGLVEEVVGYARQHPDVDALHFWLSDATNNFCECPACRQLSPSDWYVRLLKAVRRRIRREKLRTRIVFLCYTNTLTPPRKESFQSKEDHLIYMFAPISRCYSHELADASCSGVGRAGGWKLNRAKAPGTNAEFVRIRRAWEKAFGGDSFVFDYYFWNPYLRQMNPLWFARMIGADISSYAELHLNGLVSCQALRSFYPIGLGMESMAVTLWDKDAEIEQMIWDYLAACFGPDAEAVRDYLARLDSLLRPTEAEPHRGALEAGDPERARRILEFTGERASLLAEMDPANPTADRFKALLTHFNRLLSLRSRLIILEKEGRTDESDGLRSEIADFLRSTEELTHRYLDLWLLLRSLRL